MARLNFRQGIVSHQTDTSNNPTFLNVNNGNVDLLVSPDFTIIAFVHGTSDYLYTETTSVTAAWGPFATDDYWLYWDMNPATGAVTRGFTTLEPIEQAFQPTGNAVGQMWFNSTTNVWFEYNGATFVEVIRVFAAKLNSGTILESVSINAPIFTGTQVGLTTPTRVGSLVFSTNGKPVFKDKNRFFTTEDRFLTGVPTGASLRVNSVIVTGQAVQPLAAYGVVQYNDFGKIGQANPYTQGYRLYGIIEEDAVTNEVVNFITEGVITNEAWNWPAVGATANTPVYVGQTGLITLTPTAPGQLPVGVVTGRNEIVFAPSLFPQVTVQGGGGGGSAGATPAQAAQIAQNTGDITSNASNIVSNADDITALDTRVAANETNISQLQVEIAKSKEVYLPFSFQDTLPDATVVANFAVPRDLRLETTGHSGYALTASTGPASGVFQIYKNESQLIGTITFDVENKIASFAIGGVVTFQPGDVITIQTTTQEDLANAAITLRLTKVENS